MKKPDPTIRIVKATRDHLPRVVDLMRGLAEFEKSLDEFRVTEALLERHIFGRKPASDLLVGILGDEIRGYALFFQSFSSFQGRPGIYLEDVYVEPSARGKGLGKALLVEVIRTARARGCRRCEWIVLDRNHRAKHFYESLGAKLKLSESFAQQKTAAKKAEERFKEAGKKKKDADEKIKFPAIRFFAINLNIIVVVLI